MSAMSSGRGGRAACVVALPPGPQPIDADLGLVACGSLASLEVVVVNTTAERQSLSTSSCPAPFAVVGLEGSEAACPGLAPGARHVMRVTCVPGGTPAPPGSRVQGLAELAVSGCPPVRIALSATVQRAVVGGKREDADEPMADAEEGLDGSAELQSGLLLTTPETDARGLLLATPETDPRGLLLALPVPFGFSDTPLSALPSPPRDDESIEAFYSPASSFASVEKREDGAGQLRTGRGGRDAGRAAPRPSPLQEAGFAASQEGGARGDLAESSLAFVAPASPVRGLAPAHRPTEATGGLGLMRRAGPGGGRDATKAQLDGPASQGASASARPAPPAAPEPARPAPPAAPEPARPSSQGAPEPARPAPPSAPTAASPLLRRLEIPFSVDASPRPWRATGAPQVAESPLSSRPPRPGYVRTQSAGGAADRAAFATTPRASRGSTPRARPFGRGAWRDDDVPRLDLSAAFSTEGPREGGAKAEAARMADENAGANVAAPLDASSQTPLAPARRAPFGRDAVPRLSLGRLRSGPATPAGGAGSFDAPLSSRAGEEPTSARRLAVPLDGRRASFDPLDGTPSSFAYGAGQPLLTPPALPFEAVPLATPDAFASLTTPDAFATLVTPPTRGGGAAGAVGGALAPPSDVSLCPRRSASLTSVSAQRRAGSGVSTPDWGGEAAAAARGERAGAPSPSTPASLGSPAVGALNSARLRRAAEEREAEAALGGARGYALDGEPAASLLDLAATPPGLVARARSLERPGSAVLPGSAPRGEAGWRGSCAITRAASVHGAREPLHLSLLATGDGRAKTRTPGTQSAWTGASAPSPRGYLSLPSPRGSLSLPSPRGSLTSPSPRKSLASPSPRRPASSDETLVSFQLRSWMEDVEAAVELWLPAVLDGPAESAGEEQTAGRREIGRGNADAHNAPPRRRRHPLHEGILSDPQTPLPLASAAQEHRARVALWARQRTDATLRSAMAKLEARVDRGQLGPTKDPQGALRDLPDLRAAREALACYDPFWLRLACEMVTGRKVEGAAGAADGILQAGDLDRFVREHILGEFGPEGTRRGALSGREGRVTAPGSARGDARGGAEDVQAAPQRLPSTRPTWATLAALTLKRALLLVAILDRAPFGDPFGPSVGPGRAARHPRAALPLLFRPSAPLKSSEAVAKQLFARWLRSEGDVLRSLGRMGYALRAEQTPLQEMDWRLPPGELATGFRDGLRLCRLGDVLLGRSGAERGRRAIDQAVADATGARRKEGGGSRVGHAGVAAAAHRASSSGPSSAAAAAASLASSSLCSTARLDASLRPARMRNLMLALRAFANAGVDLSLGGDAAAGVPPAERGAGGASPGRAARGGAFSSPSPRAKVGTNGSPASSRRPAAAASPSLPPPSLETIAARLADGDRETTLRVLWSVFASLGLPDLVDDELLREDVAKLQDELGPEGVQRALKGLWPQASDDGRERPESSDPPAGTSALAASSPQPPPLPSPSTSPLPSPLARASETLRSSLDRWMALCAASSGRPLGGTARAAGCGLCALLWRHGGADLVRPEGVFWPRGDEEPDRGWAARQGVDEETQLRRLRVAANLDAVLAACGVLRGGDAAGAGKGAWAGGTAAHFLATAAVPSFATISASSTPPTSAPGLLGRSGRVPPPVVTALAALLAAPLLESSSEERAARVLQRAWRRRLARRPGHAAAHLHRWVEAARTIERAAAAWLCRARVQRAFDDLRRRRLALARLQARWRARKPRAAFLKVRRSALAVQAAWRGKQGRRRAHDEYLVPRILDCASRAHARLARRTLQARRERAATALQAAWRGAEARARYGATKSAALRAQRLWRGVLARRQAAERRRAVVVIQSAYRALLARREAAQRRRAAEAIGAAARGHLVRRRLAERRAAATRIQAAWRGSAQRARFRALRAAATAVAARWRGLQARRLARRRLAAVRLLQQTYRSARLRRVDRERFEALKAAAIVVQSRWRGALARREAARRTAAVVRVQALWRARQARRAFVRLRRAATVLQAWWRGRQARLEVERMRAAAARIQATWRAHAARRRFLALRAAAVEIQSAWRTQLAARKARAVARVKSEMAALARAMSQFAERTRAARVIQAAERGRVARIRARALAAARDRERARRRAVEDRARATISAHVPLFRARMRLLEARRAAPVIQAAWRARLARLSAAATRIQALQRGRAVRARVRELTAAALVVQTRWRGHRVRARHPHADRLAAVRASLARMQAELDAWEEAPAAAASDSGSGSGAVAARPRTLSQSVDVACRAFLASSQLMSAVPALEVLARCASASDACAREAAARALPHGLALLRHASRGGSGRGAEGAAVALADAVTAVVRRAPGREAARLACPTLEQQLAEALAANRERDEPFVALARALRFALSERPAVGEKRRRADGAAEARKRAGAGTRGEDASAGEEERRGEDVASRRDPGPSVPAASFVPSTSSGSSARPSTSSLPCTPPKGDAAGSLLSSLASQLAWPAAQSPSSFAASRLHSRSRAESTCLGVSRVLALRRANLLATLDKLERAKGSDVTARATTRALLGIERAQKALERLLEAFRGCGVDAGGAKGDDAENVPASAAKAPLGALGKNTLVRGVLREAGQIRRVE